MKEISTTNVVRRQRRTTLLIFSLLFLYQGFAQDDNFRPILEDMKTWEYEYHHFIEEEGMDVPEEMVYTVRHTLFGDTVINGIGYYKMYQEVDSCLTYFAAYREEGKKVYVRLPEVFTEKERDYIVVDFEYDGLYDPYTDSLYLGEYENHILSSIKDTIDHIVVERQVYRRHTYYLNDLNSVLAIGVEGVGYQRLGLAYPIIFGMNPACATCDYQVFTACYDKDGNMFLSSDFTKEGMNNNAIHKIDMTLNNSHKLSYDLFGRRIHQGSHGIYIQNRKKFVVK